MPRAKSVTAVLIGYFTGAPLTDARLLLDVASAIVGKREQDAAPKPRKARKPREAKAPTPARLATPPVSEALPLGAKVPRAPRRPKAGKPAEAFPQDEAPPPAPKSYGLT